MFGITLLEKRVGQTSTLGKSKGTGIALSSCKDLLPHNGLLAQHSACTLRITQQLAADGKSCSICHWDFMKRSLLSAAAGTHLFQSFSIQAVALCIVKGHTSEAIPDSTNAQQEEYEGPADDPSQAQAGQMQLLYHSQGLQVMLCIGIPPISDRKEGREEGRGKDQGGSGGCLSQGKEETMGAWSTLT